VNGLAVNSTAVYWVYLGSNSPLVNTCAIAGCGNSPSPLSSVVWAQGTEPLAVDDTYIYWNSLDYGGVLRCPLVGCSSPSGLSGSISNAGLARDPTVGHVYWGDYSGGISKWSLDGGVQVVNDTGGRYEAPIASDGTNVYFMALVTSGSNGIMRCPVGSSGGGSCALLTPFAPDAGSAAPGSLASDGTNVYWPLGGSVYACAVGGCASPTALASGRSGSLAVATDGARVYWAESGSIVACAPSGCGGNPTTVTTGLNSPTLLAVDGSNLYWYDSGGKSIMKVAKP
jgi:hypothetical protein